MHIVVNGEAQEVEVGLTVGGLIQLLGFEGPVAVELNRNVVPRAEHAGTRLQQNDTLEIVHFVGGG